MKIALRAHGWVKTRIGSNATEFILPDDAMLIDLINQLAETIPDFRLGNIWDKTTGRFLAPIFVIVEQREVHDFSLRLKEGQEIALISPTAGG
ncbi:MAG: MoaD/ThiS family protein [Anaerolineaceae bacterium]